MISPIGFSDIRFNASYLYGTLPFPLLIIHPANRTYFYSEYSYNLMNVEEFVSDHYVGLNIDHYFNGFFFNKIPLLKKLRLRELIGKILFGGLRRKITLRSIRIRCCSHYEWCNVYLRWPTSHIWRPVSGFIIFFLFCELISLKDLLISIILRYPASQYCSAVTSTFRSDFFNEMEGLKSDYLLIDYLHITAIGCKGRNDPSLAVGHKSKTDVIGYIF